MARTKKTPRMREGKRALPVRTKVEQGPPVLGDPPVPEVGTPLTQSELERRIEEVEKLGEVGRFMESSLTQQLAQMAAEAGPSTLDREELAKRKLSLTMGGKVPWKEFLWAIKVKRP